MNDEVDRLRDLCAQAYQIVGALADELGIFGTDEIEKVLAVQCAAADRRARREGAMSISTRMTTSWLEIIHVNDETVDVLVRFAIDHGLGLAGLFDPALMTAQDRP